jgi:hypothetical protein
MAGGGPASGEDGVCGSDFAGAAGVADGEKPILKGACCVGPFGGSTGAGFSFSGKFGSAEVSGAVFG